VLKQNALIASAKQKITEHTRKIKMGSTPSIGSTGSSMDAAYNSLLQQDQQNTMQLLQFQQQMNNINNERDMIQAGAIH
jgi:hypothetical protein